MRRLRHFSESLFLAVFLLMGFIFLGSTVASAQSVVTEAVPSNSTPAIDDVITVAVNVDMTGAPGEKLGSYTATLNWNTSVLEYVGYSGGTSPFNDPTVNDEDVDSGLIRFSDASSSGATGTINTMNVQLRAIASGTSTLDLEYSAMSATSPTFTNLLLILTANDGSVTVPTPNTAPYATNVFSSGTPQVGETLTGNYTYNDDDSDPEGTSTFRWLRDGIAISGATSQTYTIVSADEGTLITFEVTPVAQTGVSPGEPVESDAVGPVTPADTAPYATDVSISGTAEVGQTLTGNYTYNDEDGDPEGASTFRWLRDSSAISGATSQTYTLVAADEGALITFEATPVALTGVSPGDPVVSDAVGPVAPANTAPYATDVSISGTAEVGQTLTGSYTYNDDDGDPEGTSTFRWLRNGLAISGATSQAYTLVAADEGVLISFEVTPVAQTGVSPGDPVESDAVLPVTTGIEDNIKITDLPTEFALQQNYPNPFNPQTRIQYQLPKESQVKLNVYNGVGQHISTLVDDKKSAGHHAIMWTATDDSGQLLPAGIYVCRIKAGDFTSVRKMLLVK